MAEVSPGRGSGWTRQRLAASGRAWRAMLRRPRHVNVEATTRCQLHCATCPVGRGLRRQAGDLSFETFVHLLDRLRWPIERMNWIMGGEPLLHPRLFDLVALAASRDIRSKIDTNGMRLESAVPEVFRSRTHLINVVLEDVHPQRAASLRRGYQLPQVLAGLSRLCEERRRRGLKWPRISLNCLVGRHNEDHLAEVVALARGLGVDFINFKSINFNVGSLLDARRVATLQKRLAPRTATYDRYRALPSSRGVSAPSRAHCAYLSHDLTILHNGDVVPCCLDFEGLHVLGNVRDHDLLALWRSKHYRHLRAVVLGGPGLDICRACTAGARTSIVQRVLPALTS